MITTRLVADRDKPLSINLECLGTPSQHSGLLGVGASIWTMYSYIPTALRPSKSYEILVTAKSPNFSFPFWIWLLGIWGLDLGLGLRLVNKIKYMVCWLIFPLHIHLGTGHTHCTRIFEPNNKLSTLLDYESLLDSPECSIRRQSSTGPRGYHSAHLPGRSRTPQEN